MQADKPSQTAVKIATTVIILGSDAELESRLPAGIAETTARLLIAAGAYPKALVDWLLQGHLKGLIRGLATVFPKLYGVGYRGIGYRKIFCERQVREGIAEGASQILMFGGGYDTLCWRLAPEYPAVQFVEIDHPATSRLKVKGIQKMGTYPNYHLISADLSQSALDTVLDTCPVWSKTALAVFIAEGLLMYLRPGDIRKLLKQCLRYSARGSRFAFDHLFRRSDGQPDLGILTEIGVLTFKLLGEPIHWSIQPRELPAFLEGSGWQACPELIGEPTDILLEAFAVLRSDGL